MYLGRGSRRLRCLEALFRGIICGLKFSRTRRRSEQDRFAAPAVFNAELSVAVPIAARVGILYIQGYNLIQSTTSSQGPLSRSASDSAANAASSFIRSQTVRPLMRTAFGMRPSFTIASKSDGDIPTYAAAWMRDKPRGGRLDGSTST